MSRYIDVDTVLVIVEDVFDEAIQKRWTKGTILKNIVFRISSAPALALPINNQDQDKDKKE